MDLSGRRRLIALALGLMLPLAACSDDTPESPDISSGDTVEGRLDDVKAGKAVDVITPAGRLSVAFADPIDGLTEEQSTDLNAKDAPEGGVFVPIVWSFEDADDVFGVITRVFGDSEPLEVSLGAGDRKYKITPPSTGSKKSVQYLAVEGNGKDLKLEVAYGEVTQTLDVASGELDKGAAAKLYDLADTKVKIKKCPIKQWLDNPLNFVQYKCDYTTAIASPYVANTWVEPGHTWLAVNVATTLVLFATGSFVNEAIANYDVEDVTDLSTVNGKKPLGTLQEVENGGASSGIMVFDVKGELPRTMDVLREYKLTLSGAAGEVDAPQRRSVKIGGELRLSY
jgi:hypothetical protein